MYTLKFKIIVPIALYALTASYTPATNRDNSSVSINITPITTNPAEVTDGSTQDTLDMLKKLKSIIVPAGVPTVDQAFDINKTLDTLMGENDLLGVKTEAGGNFIFISRDSEYLLLAVNTLDCPQVCENFPDMVLPPSKVLQGRRKLYGLQFVDGGLLIGLQSYVNQQALKHSAEWPGV